MPSVRIRRSAFILVAAALTMCAEQGLRADGQTTTNQLSIWLQRRRPALRTPLLRELVRADVGTRATELVRGVKDFVSAYNEVPLKGGFRHVGRELVGFKHEVDPPREMLIPQGTQVSIGSIEVNKEWLVVRLYEPVRLTQARVRFEFHRDFVEELSALEILNRLRIVFDFGGDLDAWQSLDSAFRRADAEARGAEERAFSTRGSVEERVVVFTEALDALVAARTIFTELVNRVGPHGLEPGLAARLYRIEAALGPLQEQLAAERSARADEELPALIEGAIDAVSTWSRERDLEHTEGLRDQLSAIVSNRELASTDSAQEEALERLRGVLTSVSHWLVRYQERQQNGCPTADALSRDKVRSLLTLQLSQAALAGEISRCGIGFEPTEALTAEFAGLGATEDLVQAIRRAEVDEVIDAPTIAAILKAIVPVTRAP